MKKAQYIINGKSYTPESNDQLIDLVRINLKMDGELNITKEERPRTLSDHLENIRLLSWEAQAGLSGIIALVDKVRDVLYGNSLDDDATMLHISWLQIYVRDKVKESMEVFDEAHSIENEMAKLEMDARKERGDQEFEAVRNLVTTRTS